jgi:hypothetical protein
LIQHLAGMITTLAPALWAGLVLGAGFVAVHAVFAGLEFAKPFAYAAARVFQSLPTAEWLFALMGAQAIWLRPELLARANIMASGGQLEASAAHAIYSALEMCKLAWLSGLAYAGRVLSD